MDAVTPQVVFIVFGIPITNTIISTWFIMGIVIIFAWFIRKYRPGISEIIIESINGIVSSVMPDDIKVIKYLPILGSLAIFLMISNIFSFIPFMVSPTANINTTIALALVVFFAVHIYGIREKGLVGYLKDFSKPIFILPLEIVSQVSRTLSLSIRLFGNIISTDLIVAIIFSLIPFFLPLPLVALSMLTGVLQAYIFTVLASLYIASAVEVEEFEQERRRLKQQAKNNHI
ncbi:MAG: F0F1 ATP synthase subunit A [Brevefilum sp.]|nr:F0F1 ATP synthase subunit A [Brevefilum sp.]